MDEPLQARSVKELCAERDRIDAELHRRAAAADVLRYGGPRTSSVTIISHDGESVLVAFYEDSGLVVASRDRLRFPTYGGAGGGNTQDRWFGSENILPLNVYEGGRSAIAAWREEEDRQRLEERERYEREQYDKLRIKFGDA